MPGVLSTLRDQEHTIDQNNNNNVPIINAPETTIFESNSYESSFESNYSDTESDTDFFNCEETAEEIEATRFLNELLKNQCQKDGDVERIQSMLLSRQSPPKSSINDSSDHKCLSSNCCSQPFSLPCGVQTTNIRNSSVVQAPSSSSGKISPSKHYPLVSQKQVYFESKQDRLAYESQEKFTNSQTILSIVSKRCCKKDCLQKLSPNAANFDYKESMQFVYFVRKDLTNGANNQEDIELNVRNVIQANTRDRSNNTQRLRCDYQLSSPKFMNNQKVPLCRNSFCAVLDLVKRKREKILKAIKTETNHNNISMKTFNDRTQVSAETFRKVQDVLVQSDIKIDWNTLTNFVVPNSVATMRCKSWMKQFFNLVGDKMPNTVTEEIHLDCMKKKDVYEEYTTNMRNWHGETVKQYLSLVAFNKLWDNFFPHVKVREHKAVSGKCTTCERLSSLRRNSKDMRSRSQLTLLHAFHREMYMGERAAYYDRAEQAMFDPTKYMSLMIDGMDKNKTKIPRFSQNLQQEWQMSQHITGILDHGRGSFFYRSYPNMRNDGNEGIHCLLLHLANRLEESHVDKENRFLPQTLYIQSDGGGQFNNKTTLAILAFIVARRVGGIKKIVFSRLPVGHTHDDADAKFGEIWRTTLTTLTLTPAEYKAMVISCLGKHARAEVIDIFVCPNYSELFKPCLDPHWKYLKEDGTQLQYTFQSVPRSETYRMGVKTNYRAYSKERVFEIIPVDAEKLSHVYSTDYRVMYSKIPDEPENPKEIVNLIERYPFDIIKPSGFVSGSSRSYAVTLAAIKKYFGEKSKTVHEWQIFVNPFLPIHDSVQEYLRNIDWNSSIPLKQQLFGPDHPVDQSLDIPAVESVERGRVIKDKSDNYYFDGLRVVYAKSTASVKHRGNLGKSVPDHREILEDQAMATNPAMAQKLFVKSILSLPITTLADKIKKYLTEGNIKHPKNANKEVLLKTLKDFYRPQLEEMEKAQLLQQVSNNNNNNKGVKRKHDDNIGNKIIEQSDNFKSVKIESKTISDLFSKDNLQAMTLKLGISVEMNKSTGRLKGINSMKQESLRKVLFEFHLDTTGSTAELRSRLEEFVTLKTNESCRT